MVSRLLPLVEPRLMVYPLVLGDGRLVTFELPSDGLTEDDLRRVHAYIDALMPEKD